MFCFQLENLKSYGHVPLCITWTYTVEIKWNFMVPAQQSKRPRNVTSCLISKEYEWAIQRTYCGPDSHTVELNQQWNNEKYNRAKNFFFTKYGCALEVLHVVVWFDLKAFDSSNLFIWITVNQLQIWCVNSTDNNLLFLGYIWKQGHPIKIRTMNSCITETAGVHHGDCRNARIIWHRCQSNPIETQNPRSWCYSLFFQC